MRSSVATEQRYGVGSGDDRLGLPFILIAMAHHVAVSVDDSHDPLNRMRAHKIAESLIGDAFADATKLKAEIIPRERGKTMK